MHTKPSVVMFGRAVRPGFGSMVAPSDRYAGGRALLCSRGSLLLLGLCFALACARSLFSSCSGTVDLSFSFCRLTNIPRRLRRIDGGRRGPICRWWKCAWSVVGEKAWRCQWIIRYYRRVSSTLRRRLTLVPRCHETRRRRIKIGIKPFRSRRIVRYRMNVRVWLATSRGLRSSVCGLPLRLVVRG